MVNHGRVRSTVQPDPVKFDEYNVWVHNNIIPISEPTSDNKNNKNNKTNGFEYDMVQYDKDEYQRYLIEKNTADIDYILIMSDL